MSQSDGWQYDEVENDTYADVTFSVDENAYLHLDDFNDNEVSNKFSEENGMFYSLRKSREGDDAMYNFNKTTDADQVLIDRGSIATVKPESLKPTQATVAAERPVEESKPEPKPEIVSKPVPSPATASVAETVKTAPAPTAEPVQKSVSDLKTVKPETNKESVLSEQPDKAAAVQESSARVEEPVTSTFLPTETAKLAGPKVLGKIDVQAFAHVVLPAGDVVCGVTPRLRDGHAPGGDKLVCVVRQRRQNLAVKFLFVHNTVILFL